MCQGRTNERERYRALNLEKLCLVSEAWWYMEEGMRRGGVNLIREGPNDAVKDNVTPSCEEFTGTVCFGNF